MTGGKGARLITIYKETHNLIPSNISHLLARNNATLARPATRQSHETQLINKSGPIKIVINTRSTLEQYPYRINYHSKSAPNLDSFKRVARKRRADCQQLSYQM